MRAFRRKGRGVQVTRAAALKSTPVKNAEVKEERLETGEVLLTYPVTIRPWIASLTRRFGGSVDTVQSRKLQLDQLGTAVWDLMDGRRSVRRVIQGFAGKYQLHIKEAEVAVTRFLRALGKRGLIGLK
ncbi:MAG: PqqD family peptide modification chaperone [Proteobacteria bacterium]|nr:PqqD family peptide modification chaperone [Pseudomonadota bacterium]